MHELNCRPTFERAPPEVFRHPVVERERLRRRGDHGHPDANIGFLPEPEWGERQHLAVGLAENLEARMRQRVGYDPDLYTDRLVGHQRGEVLGLRARAGAPLRTGLCVEIEAADQAVAQETVHLGRGNEVDDAGLALAIARLALAQHTHQLANLFERAFAALDLVGDALAQHLFQRRIEGVGGEQVGDRPRQHDDVLGRLLDLAHALEICDRRADVFDAHPEQRRHRDAEQLRELLQRLDLGELAFLETIDRGAGNAEAAGDLVGGEAGTEAKGLQAIADVIETDGHGTLYNSAIPDGAKRPAGTQLATPVHAES